MLKREDELRLSDKYQALFANPGHNAIHIAAKAQEEVAEEFGYKGYEVGAIVDVIRAATAFYPEHKEEICRIPHYLKFNRSKKGTFEVGSPLVDVPLVKLDGSMTSLFSHINSLKYNKKPILICSGSYS